jgi:hypothetical protein
VVQFRLAPLPRDCTISGREDQQWALTAGS